MAKLWIWLGLLWGQVSLPLSRLVWYDNGRVYWVREAVVPLPERKLVVKLPGENPPAGPLVQPEYRIHRWSLSPDTVLRTPFSLPPHLEGFLRQHIGASVWVSYLAGNEWEETSGVLEGVFPEGILLRKATGEQVWLPTKLLQGVRVTGENTPREVQGAWRLVLEMDTTLPAARVAVAGWDTLPPWQAYHTLRLLGPTRLALTTWANLPPLPETAYPIELYLLQRNTDSTTLSWHLPLQKITAGSSTHILLLQTEIPYTELYRALLPDLIESLDPLTIGQWKGGAERSLQLLNTEKTPIPLGQALLLDEGGLPLAEGTLPAISPTKTGYFLLSPIPTLQLRLQESEVRREKLRDPAAATKVTLSGTLRIQNGSPREVRLLVEKPLTGNPLPDKLGFARTVPLPERRGPNPRYTLTWELLLRPGATETLDYTYEVLLPTR